MMPSSTVWQHLSGVGRLDGSYHWSHEVHALEAGNWRCVLYTRLAWARDLDWLPASKRPGQLNGWR